MSAKKKVLVFGATGNQGSAVITELLKEGDKVEIFGATRNPDGGSAKKWADKGVTMVKADMLNKSTLAAAMETSQCNLVFLFTDFFSCKNAEEEIQQGKNAIDAITESKNSVEFVLYSSVGNADKAVNVEHFQSKARVEDYLKDKLPSEKWAIIRPVAFFENLDNAKNYNPLTKGKVKMLTEKDLPVKYIGMPDLGKASKAILIDKRAEFEGKTFEAASCIHTGTELAECLTKASGVPCTYSKQMPEFVFWLFMGEIYHMIQFFKDPGYSASVEEFQKLVPDAMNAEDWFRYKGEWSSPAGEKFAS